jgi:hypothetical protein
VMGCGFVSRGMTNGPLRCKYREAVSLQLQTYEVFMEITSADSTPFNCYKRFIVFGFWLWNIDNTYIVIPIELCCFHCCTKLDIDRRCMV